MKPINRSMKVSEAARLAASMNARLVAHPGRLDIEALHEMKSSRFKRCFLAGHGLVRKTTPAASQEPRRGAGEVFFNQGDCHD
jgi:hypothetical protein